jgi:hypothetical protein
MGDKEESQRRGWARIGELGPAWISAIAAVIVALAAAGFFAGRVTTPTPAPTETVTVTGQALAAGHTPPPSPSGNSIYWTGQVGLSELSGLGLDFDTKPPSSDQTTIVYQGNTLQATANAQLARWTQSSTPSVSQCQLWVTTHPNATLLYPASGMEICIKTDQGRYGLLQIDSASNDQLQVTATIWNS